MNRITIDINCDMGEGTGNDAILMPLISSANIACGFHAGDPETMRHTVQLAKKYHVAIGAHPSFFDREHFGRRKMDIAPEKIYALVIYQVGALATICKAEGARLRHVKPHGALYNQSASDPGIARAIASAVRDCDRDLVLFGLAGSKLVEAGRAMGLTVAEEAFADRSYSRDGSLTPRTQANALINSSKKATAQVLDIIREGKVMATDGSTVSLHADTICIHGDGQHAVDFARAIQETLRTHSITIQSPHAAKPQV
ncbi:5-oxoprolinase subunit PxpA [Flavihumibacter rivuli]|uniref:5-oxoprolinase subunit PxpA n=1 Tax=Flavihumibacter rivuli TaxID=2838156 RepID=UPI001BDF5FF5|nr:5-oxoprolinase subunit PxpA [Flavihumibacter rivuli]ULQ55602.1 5-oxoprolinase subunit PxpA [Flavihumibacter rivuli]